MKIALQHIIDDSTNDFDLQPYLESSNRSRTTWESFRKIGRWGRLTGCFSLWKWPSMMYSLSLPCGAIGLLTRLLEAGRCARPGSNGRKVASPCWTATVGIWKIRFKKEWHQPKLTLPASVWCWQLSYGTKTIKIQHESKSMGRSLLRTFD